MNKLFFYGLLFLIFSCNKSEKKKYEDYNEDDFVEVQGIVIKTVKKMNFQSYFEMDLYYIYNLGQDKPTKGYELKTPYMIGVGEPAVILVHKEDKNITFYGYRGTLMEEEKTLLNYLEKSEQNGGGYYGVDDY